MMRSVCGEVNPFFISNLLQIGKNLLCSHTVVGSTVQVCVDGENFAEIFQAGYS